MAQSSKMHIGSLKNVDRDPRKVNAAINIKSTECITPRRTYAAKSVILSLLSAIGLLVSLSQSLYAQQMPPSDGGHSDRHDTKTQDLKLQEVIVTATKRAERLLNAPLAVTAISQSQLQTAGVGGLKDLTSNVPDLTMKTVGLADSVQVTIRGITNSDFNQFGNPAVATYIDGVYVGRTEGLYGDLYDLARIEILRGPQGTLYGLNSTGGNVNIITANPSPIFGASAELSYGNFGDVKTQAMVNVPITDKLYVRGAFIIHRSDGYFNTLGATARNYGAADDYGGRLTTLWKPTKTFSWRLSVDDFISHGTPILDFDTASNGKPSDNLPVYRQLVPSYPEPSNDLQNLMVRSRMTWLVGRGFTLAYIAGYQHLTNDTVFGIAGQVFDGDRNDLANSYSHEADLSYDSKRLRNVLGVNYFHMINRNDDAYHFYNYGISLTNGVRPDSVLSQDWGVFDQATYSLSRSLRLVGGARYSDDSQRDYGETQMICAGVTMPFPSLEGGIVRPGCSVSPQATGSGSWKKLSWKTGIEYDFSHRTSSYAMVTTGFKAGGLNLGVPGPQKTFKPENVINYEIGLKTRQLNQRLSMNSAFFYEDYSDIQVTQLSGGQGTAIRQITTNAAKAAIYGAELEGKWLVTRSDRLSGFLDYLHATYTKYRDAVDQETGIVYPSLDGRSLPNAPRFSARLQYSHDFVLSSGGVLTPLVAVYWQTTSYLREFNLPIDRVGGYSKTNMELTYMDSTGDWKMQGYVNNLENKAVRNGGFTVIGHYFSDYNPPRTYGVRISYRY